MSIKEEIEQLQKVTRGYSVNTLLNNFDLESLEYIEDLATKDEFIKSKRNKISKLIKKLSVDYNEKLKTAFDEYSEAMTYIYIRDKKIDIENVPERSGIKTPDFKINIKINGQEKKAIFAELKTLSYSSGSINYTEPMIEMFNAKLKMEEERTKGKKKTSSGFICIQPLKNDNKNYDPYSIIYLINELSSKLIQNIKPGQYKHGETVLIIDLKQIVIPQDFMQIATPVFVESQFNSLVSGILWNLAFGKESTTIYKCIEFEGKPNIEGELGNEGILNQFDFIKAIIFQKHEPSENEPKIIGLKRFKNTPDSIDEFLYQYCDFVNDDLNSYGFECNTKC